MSLGIKMYVTIPDTYVTKLRVIREWQIETWKGLLLEDAIYFSRAMETLS